MRKNIIGLIAISSIFTFAFAGVSSIFAGYGGGYYEEGYRKVSDCGRGCHGRGRHCGCNRYRGGCWNRGHGCGYGYGDGRWGWDDGYGRGDWGGDWD